MGAWIYFFFLVCVVVFFFFLRLVFEDFFSPLALLDAAFTGLAAATSDQAGAESVVATIAAKANVRSLFMPFSP